MIVDFVCSFSESIKNIFFLNLQNIYIYQMTEFKENK